MEDYFDNDELNEMFNNDDNENFDKYSNIPEEEFEGMVEEMERFRFEKMVHENYKNIKEKGIDIVTMASYQDETIDRLKTTLGVMLDFFEKREEYEKCADIRDISDKIKEHGL